MKTKRSKKPSVLKSVLAFALVAAMVAGMSGTSTLAAEVGVSGSGSDSEVQVFSATEENQTIIVHQEEDGSIPADTSFTYHLYRITGSHKPITSMDDITAYAPGSDLSYTLYDTGTGKQTGSGTTDASGAFSLTVGESAQFDTVAAGTDWFVEQDAPDDYPLLSVTANGAHASVVGKSRGVVQYEEAEPEPEPTVDVTGTKTWDDANDQDGVRPDNITVNLLADGELMESRTVSEDEDGTWTYQFTDLLQYGTDGHEIRYTITEDEVEDYASSVDGYDITNTHDPATALVHGSIVWLDADNEDGVRPESVTVILLKDGEVADSVTVTASDGWTWDLGEWPVYEAGRQITYYVVESTVDDYSTEYGYESEDNDYDVTITNTHTPEETSLTVMKVWDDTDDQDGRRPASVTFTLLRDGDVATDEEGDPITLTVSESTGWMGTVTGILRYHDEGTEYTYTFREPDVANYQSDQTAVTDTAYVCVNTHSTAETSVSVQKTWEDFGDRYGVRPGSVTVNLLADGTEIREITLSAANGWAGTFSSLPVYHDHGQAITYTVTEDAPTFYEADISGSAEGGYTITNTCELESADYTVTVDWQDENDQDGIRPTSVMVYLLSNGQRISDDQGGYLAAVLNENNGWTCTFTDIGSYRNGEPAVYTVETEGVPAEYAETMGTFTEQGDGAYALVITETYTPKLYNGDGELPVTKVWTDGDDAYTSERPDSVEVELLMDGEASGKTLTLSKDNGWTGSFTGLQRYEKGDEISYSVQETTEKALEYYTPEVTQNADGSITLTNHQKYYDLDEELVPDETDRDSWVKNESVNEYNAIEIEMSTSIPDIEGSVIAAGDYTITFHDVLDSALVLDETDADFSVYIGDSKVSHDYYTIMLESGETKPAALHDAITDGCTFHVDVDLSGLYNDGVISDTDLQGDTEIMVFFFADLEGTGLNGSYTSTAWYDIQSGGEVLYTSDADVVTVYTYEITLKKYDVTFGTALSGATFGIYYDKACTEAVSRNNADYTAVSDTTGIVDFYGLAGGTYYVKELAAPEGYLLDTSVTTIVLDDSLNDKAHTYTGGLSNAELYNPENPKDPGYVPGTITVTKTWIDDGTIRPASVEIVLLADGAEVQTAAVEPAKLSLSQRITSFFRGQTASDANGWTCTFTDLVKYNDAGDEIIYTVEEIPVQGYRSETSYGAGNGSVTDGTATVTNTQLINTDDDDPTNDGILTAEKVWNDGGDARGLRGSYALTLTGTVNGQTVYTDTQTLPAGTTSYRWSDLVKYDENGNEITYAMTETTVPDGYAESYSEDGLTVTNTLLYLPDTGPGGGDPDPGYTPGTITLTKVWDDGSDRDGVRPSTIRISLLANGETATDVNGNGIPSSATDNGDNTWTVTFSNLPAYDEAGNKIAYTVTEEALSGYEATISYGGNSTSVTDGTATITNRHTVDLVNGNGQITAQKVWDDDNDNDGIRSSYALTLTGTADGKEVYQDTRTLSASTLTYTWSGLYAKEDGKDITYTLAETTVPDGYTAAVSGSAEAGFTVTNTHDDETLGGDDGKLTVTKTWVDNADNDHMRPGNVTFTLTDGESAVTDGSGKDVTLTLTSADADASGSVWTGAIDVSKLSLNRYKDGEEIAYTLTEEEVNGYVTTCDTVRDAATGAIDGFTVTNTHGDYEAVINVTKTWEGDDEWADIYRPDEVKAHLTGGSLTGDGDAVTLTPDDWTWTSGDEKLPVNQNGEPIRYTIHEDSVPGGYMTEDGTVSFTQDSTGEWIGNVTITNTFITTENDPDPDPDPKSGEVTGKLIITKAWNDGNKSHTDDTVTVTVSSSNWTDDKTGEPVITKTVTIGAGDSWTVEVSGLPAYETDGTTRVLYTVTEDTPTGYQSSVSDFTLGTGSDGTTNTYTTVTNTQLLNGDDDDPSNDGRLTVTKVWVDDGTIRPESIDITLLGNGKTVSTGTISGTSPSKLASRMLHGILSTLRAGAQVTEWTYTFEDLPAYDGSGNAIRYTLSEVGQTGYQSKITYSGGTYVTDGTATVTNTQLVNAGDGDPTTTGVIKVSKTWKDNDNAYTTRPGSITVHLVNGTTVVDTLTMNAGSGWSGSFTDVVAYDEAGNEIAYTVSEDAITLTGGDSYTAAVSGTIANGFTITNTLTGTLGGDSGTLTVTKQWIDDSNHDGLRPNSITAILCTEDASGNTTPVNNGTTTATLSGTGDTWSGTLDVGTSLPRYDENGAEIAYTLTETGTGGYLSEYAQVCTAVTDAAGAITGFTLSNTHSDHTGTVTLTKTWAENQFNSLYQPSEITVKITANGEADRTVTLKASENWTTTLEGVNVVSGGEYIQYTVSDEVTNFISEPGTITFTQDRNGNWVGSVEITNSLITTPRDPDPEGADPDKGEIAGALTIVKEWNDASSSHSAVNVTVSSTNWKNGTTPVISEQVTLNSGNSWSATITDLPAYKTDGTTRVQYEVTEDTPSGYVGEVGALVTNADRTETTVTVTNTALVNGDGKITVNKVWEDDDKTDKRGDYALTLTGVAGDDEVYSSTKTFTPDVTTCTWDGLTQYFMDANHRSQEITYTVTETTVPEGYTPIYSDDGLTITNVSEEIYYDVKYAVAIYGIYHDVDEQGNPLGLTFGPATGACYWDTYKAHLTQSQYESGNYGVCLHWMTWDEIVEQSAKDPTVFEDCLENGCTHAVNLNLNDTLFNTSYYKEMDGDGSGMLYATVNPTYRGWNTTSSNAGGYPASAIRDTLIGTGKRLTTENCLLSCFPTVLQENIVPKAVQSNTVYNSSSSSDVATTYDALWLFSRRELGSTTTSFNYRYEGSKYARLSYYSTIGNASEDDLRKNYCDVPTYSGTGQKVETDTWTWWERSIASSGSIYAAVVTDSGSVMGDASAGGSSSLGIAPGFCLR